jgi:hypothetical protein
MDAANARAEKLEKRAVNVRQFLCHLFLESTCKYRMCTNDNTGESGGSHAANGGGMGSHSHEISRHYRRKRRCDYACRAFNQVHMFFCCDLMLFCGKRRFNTITCCRWEVIAEEKMLELTLLRDRLEEVSHKVFFALCREKC